jgi:uncharacterized NAD(P)/FAD-binding protein YdhS
MPGHIAIVGTGPTGIYAFRHILDQGGVRAVTLFEKGDRAGIGMPYSPENADRTMLANIASIEIPPVTMTYLDWLRRQPAATLHRNGLSPDALHDRLFTPRLLLGAYFRDELMALVDRAREAGIRVHVNEGTEVADVTLHEGAVHLQTADGTDAGPFDRVILATGHDFPDEDEATRSYFPSPWSGLIQAEVPAVRVGIMGTSLGSIDAVMAVTGQHGRFARDGDDLSFHTEASGLHITMMSWTGVLPEADFYCPIPYEPLAIMTEQAVADCAGQPQPLDALFDLFRVELHAADPAYAARIGLADLTADSFADAYFAEREAQDPFRWARRNLAEVEYNKAHRITVPWRYALLRMHERVEGIVPDLSEADRDRFDKGLKTVFVDNYAAVPSESIRRLLALRDAGVLSVLALGYDYDLDRRPDGTVIRTANGTHEFEVFIDARGQRPLTSKDIPFPTLRRAVLAAGQEIPERTRDFCLTGVDGFAGRVFLAAIPWLMHDRPFVQGICVSDEIGEVIAGALARDAGRPAGT